MEQKGRFPGAVVSKHGDDFTHNWQGSMKGASIFDERISGMGEVVVEVEVTGAMEYDLLAQWVV